MFSVVIPAHNEEAVIARCLREMSRGAQEGELEIVVVANGCTDRTAEIARGCGADVMVIETDFASKSNALRLGEEAVEQFPRFYADADIVLPIESIREVGNLLEQGTCLAAAPKIRVDLTGSTWAVRAYYDVWTSLPYHASGMIGSGVYAISEEGRRRFDVFPDIISDDGFVRLHFAPDERKTVENAWFMISAPNDLSGVLAVKTRSQKGAVQLKRLYPELLKNDVRSYKTPLLDILSSPRRWPKAAVYFYVIVKTKLRAYWMNYFGGLGGWERDETSRAAVERVETGADERSTIK